MHLYALQLLCIPPHVSSAPHSSDSTTAFTCQSIVLCTPLVLSSAIRWQMFGGRAGAWLKSGMTLCLLPILS